MLNEDGVFWVTRSKESLCFRVVKRLPKATDKRILSDELVVLKNKDSRANYPQAMHRLRALVEVDGKEREMEFLTNNLQWSAGSVADLYAEADKIVFRSGVHLGEVIVEDNDLYGDAVNIAARLQGEAPPGGILISRAVREAASGRIKAEFQALGELSLKT